MSKVIFIIGPTAVGKTEIAYLLAKKLNAQIISCDSMLVYREPQIITSKPQEYMLRDILHHFINIISVEETYSVFDYYIQATAIIRKLFYNDVNVVVCGGSGLYIKSLLDGIFEGGAKDKGLRDKLKERAQMYGVGYLYEELRKVDPYAAERIHPRDLKRIIRALEEYYLTGTPISQKQAYSYGLYGELPIKIFGLRRQRKFLYKRIDMRVDNMFENGAIEEVEWLRSLRLSITAKHIIGIKEIGAFLEGEINQEQAREMMKKNTRHLAKKQIIWFRKDKRIEWLDIDDIDEDGVVDNIINRINL